MYINDISTHLDNPVRLFADDTSLYIIVDNDILTFENALTHDLGKIKQWSDMWAVEFNTNKTVNLDFGRRSVSHPKVKFGTDGSVIKNVETHTHLGIKFQQDGSWRTHILDIHSKACTRLNILRMLKHTLKRDALIKIYFAFVRPVLEYSDIVWDNCSDRDAKLLEDIQVAAARIISGLRSNSSRSLLYDELGWDTLEVRRKIHKLVLFYKIVYGLVPQYLVELLGQCLLRVPQNSYPLRNQDNRTFQIPQAKTTSYMESFLPSTIRLWNELPYNIRSLSTLSSFTHAIKNMYCSKAKKYFNYGVRRENIIHCQLRNSASNLNDELFNHFLIDNPSCDMCGINNEHVLTFLLNVQNTVSKDIY